MLSLRLGHTYAIHCPTVSGTTFEEHAAKGSNSTLLLAWSSPVVMVRKKDGSHRFGVDLNAVTKPDTSPLPRIDDLLDQLGRAW